VRSRALDNETQQIGLSIGDEALRAEVLQIDAFQGVDGEFDREGYRYALRQAGLSEGEFETSLREEAARTLLQNAVLGGVQMPDTYAQTLLNYVGELRSFTWSTLDASALENPIPAATPEDLRAYYDDNPDLFVLPASKQITYVWLKPEDLLDEIEIPEETLRAEYEARANVYNQPERRLVERLVFADQESADQAAAALEVSGTTFNALVEDRGLNLADVDLGDVGRLELDAAGEAVFAAESGAVVGPLPTSLGPALFRVNGVLAAQSTPFEEARAELQGELATASAVRAVEARAQDLDDQLAGGATLEQLAEETEMTLGTLDWTAETSAGIAAYEDFRAMAATFGEGDFPQIAQLDDGGIFAMRLDGDLPERPTPYEDATADVTAAWRNAETVSALSTQAETLKETLQGDGSFEEAGLDAMIETDQTRGAFVEGTPADFMSTLFDLEPGAVATLPSDNAVVILRVDSVTEATESPDNATLLQNLSAQVNQTLAQDVLSVYTDSILFTNPPQINQQALQAVHVNFP
jgi:peptidyl-prolyl cis-trans isomerase D